MTVVPLAPPTRLIELDLHAAATELDRASGLRVEHDVFVRLFGTHDQREGMRAFLEKREPGFEGR